MLKPAANETHMLWEAQKWSTRMCARPHVAILVASWTKVPFAKAIWAINAFVSFTLLREPKNITIDILFAVA